MRHPALFSTSVLLVLALGAGAWMLHTRQQTTQAYETQIATLRKQITDRAAQSSLLEADLSTLRGQLAAKGIEPAVAPRPTVRPENDTRRLETVRELTQAQSRLSAASASLTELQNRISELESSVDRLAADNNRLAASETNLKEDIDNTRNVVQAMEAELKAKNERLTLFDTTLRKAREELAAANQKSALSAPLAAEFADVNRRRENTVTGLQRRYRDVTDQLRALSVRLETNRDNPAAAVADISRLQTAVQSAEDDLRQLNALNAQAQRLAIRLSQPPK
jgi:chromosome segregation ATPase